MNQIFEQDTPLQEIVEEMKRNNVQEITRIMFLPKTKAIIISFDYNDKNENN